MWRLMPGELRRMREKCKLTRREAAKRTGLDISTIRDHENPRRAPLTLQPETIERYMETYDCKKEDFMRWESDDDGE
jgi:hypothetical protein